MASEAERNDLGGTCVCGIPLSEPYTKDRKAERFSRHTRKVTAADTVAIQADAARRRFFSDRELEEMAKSGYCPHDRGHRG